MQEEAVSEVDVLHTMRDPEFLQDTEPSSSAAFAMTMLCIDEEYEMQAREFLNLAFATFPDKVVPFIINQDEELELLMLLSANHKEFCFEVIIDLPHRVLIHYAGLLHLYIGT